MDARKKALEAVRSLADEALRARHRAKKAPPKQAAPVKRDSDMSAEDEEQLARLYEQETADIGRA